MIGASGFQEVRSSIFRSPSYRFMHEQLHQFLTGSRHLLRARVMPWMAAQIRMANGFLPPRDQILLDVAVHPKSEKVPRTFSMFCLALAIVSGLLLLSLCPLYADENLPLNSGPIEPSMKTTNEFIEMFRLKPKPKTLHGLITFPGRYVTQAEGRRLAKFGIHVLELYRNTTYWARVDRSVTPNQFQGLNINLYLTKLQDKDRVQPEIWKQNYAKFTARQPGDQPPLNYVLNDDGTLNLTVIFHSDITELQAKTVIKKYTQIMKKKSNMVWVVVAPSAVVQTLAREDLVRWIDAGPIPGRPENDNTRRAIKVDNLQNFNTASNWGSWIGSWSNNGIRVGVFDWGINEGHPDFDNRVKIPNTSLNDGHGTRVAGTIAGSGLMSIGDNGCNATAVSGSAYQWRGMAPRAYLHEEWHGNGDDVATHMNRIGNPGMHLSNHSYAVSFDGHYSPSDLARDTIIKGVQPGGTPLCGSSSFCPRLHVYSAGNTGDPCPGSTSLCPAQPFQSGYFALSKQVKNALVVGNWNYNDLSVPATDSPNIIYSGITSDLLGSSLGPAHDGRIKPDVVAPGTNICSTSESGSYYGGMTGTSAAAAAVSGSLATLLQRYANGYHVSDLNERAPLPSTLRAVMIHTADDIKVDNADPAWFSNADGPVKPTPGPDFVTGWGLVNVEKAHQIIANNSLWEHKVSAQCETRIYYFTGRTDPIRVTLAWDDPPYGGPALPRTDRKLVNDLDLILIDPNGGIHYSWKLDQTIVDLGNGGVPIPDDAQSCSTPIHQENISRQFLPTNDPEHHNDDTTGGIPSAVRGRDHLNNVEVVDVDVNASTPAIPGIWQAKVTVFRIDSYWGAQPFSLVGHLFHEASMPPKLPDNFCDVLPDLCRGDMRWGVMIPDPPNKKIRGKFSSREEKRLVRMKTLCELGFYCPPCAGKKRCSGYEVRLEKMATPLNVEVYTDKGKLVKRDASGELTKTISFKARPNEEFVFVLSPAKGTEIGKEFDVTISLGE